MSWEWEFNGLSEPPRVTADNFLKSGQATILGSAIELILSPENNLPYQRGVFSIDDEVFLYERSVRLDDNPRSGGVTLYQPLEKGVTLDDLDPDHYLSWYEEGYSGEQVPKLRRVTSIHFGIYDVFGSSSENNKRFTGQIHDVNGMNYHFGLKKVQGEADKWEAISYSFSGEGRWVERRFCVHDGDEDRSELITIFQEKIHLFAQLLSLFAA